MSEDTSKLSSNDFDDLMRAINTDIRNDAIRWACQVLVDHERTLILNTKAFGEEGKVELAEVSIINIKGEVLLSTPVKPIGVAVPTGSSIYHAPSFAQIYHRVRDFVRQANRVIAFDASAHVQTLERTCLVHGLPPISANEKFDCMLTWFKDYTGLSQSNIALDRSLTTLDGAMMVLRLLHAMAGDQSVPIASIRILQCPSCDAPVSEQATFCSQCGEKMSATTQMVYIKDVHTDSWPTSSVMASRPETAIALVGVLRYLFPRGPDGYVIGVFDYGSGKTFVSGAMETEAGDLLDIIGYWRSHPAYDPFFQVVDYGLHIPATAEEIYLWFDVVQPPGLGPVAVNRIERKLGERITTVFNEDRFDLLDNVLGLGPKRISRIKESWLSYKARAAEIRSSNARRHQG